MKKGIKIRTIIILLVLMTALCTTIVNWYSSIRAQKATMSEYYLEYNLQYANKIADSTNELFSAMKQNLEVLADIIGKEDFTQEELDNWRVANINYFNSIFTTDSEGVIQLMSPLEIPHIKVKPGVKITTDLMKKALSDKKPFISHPYPAQSGNLVLLISYPVFDSSGNYKGVVDGTIYLEKDNSLRTLMKKHTFNDGTIVLVVDNSGKIIYHPDSSRINESLASHPLIAKVLSGKSGAEQITSSRGGKYFTGYTYVKTTGWGVITQTPVSVIEEPSETLTNDIIFHGLPFLLMILVIAAIFTHNLSKPLNILATYSEEAIKYNRTPDIEVSTKSRIYEIRQLYQHIQSHFHLLNRELQKDGLTGLANRRTFDIHIEKLFLQRHPFSLIMMDIDHFKEINDNYGHLVGDDVLRFLSKIMAESSREEDLCYRYGGEEFVFILKNRTTNEAYVLAERLRKKIAATPSPTEKPITISLGISSCNKEDESPEQIIQRADHALYQSKQKGRNKTTIL